jgi:hypothetical protein
MSNLDPGTNSEALLIKEFCDVPDGGLPSDQQILNPLIISIWTLFSSKAPLGPLVQYYYAKRQCIEILFANKYNLVDNTQGGVNQSLSQRAANLLKIQEKITAEIVRLEAISRGNRTAVVTPLLKRSLQHRPRCWGLGLGRWRPNADAARYIGSPYWDDAILRE